MKTVLENVGAHCLYVHIAEPSQPEPLKDLNELAKAQLTFFAAAADALNAVQGEIEEISVSAEGDYRYVCIYLLAEL